MDNKSCIGILIDKLRGGGPSLWNETLLWWLAGRVNWKGKWRLGCVVRAIMALRAAALDCLSWRHCACSRLLIVFLNFHSAVSSCKTVSVVYFWAKTLQRNTSGSLLLRPNRAGEGRCHVAFGRSGFQLRGVSGELWGRFAVSGAFCDLTGGMMGNESFMELTRGFNRTSTRPRVIMTSLNSLTHSRHRRCSRCSFIM